jgi:NAD(P)-dependent dehydrogenase (short-subunit alcohol dehydrogenase family)
MATLITGGASGIGEATAERLVAAGEAVALVDRDAARLETVAARLGAVPIAADVSDATQAEAAVERAAQAFGGLDGLVTSAGIFDPGDLAPLADVALETFTRVLSVNLTGTFLFAKFALPHLLRGAAAGGNAAIVTVASTAGLRGHGFGSGYTASKGGVVALTRLLAFQYGPQGVRANCVCPGLTNTPMTGGAYDDPEMAKMVTRGIPLRRIAQPSETAGLICHLLSRDASYVSGQIIAADGGATVM